MDQRREMHDADGAEPDEQCFAAVPVRFPLTIHCLLPARSVSSRFRPQCTMCDSVVYRDLWSLGFAEIFASAATLEIYYATG